MMSRTISTQVIKCVGFENGTLGYSGNLLEYWSFVNFCTEYDNEDKNSVSFWRI